jgi:hypothetical protein
MVIDGFTFRCQVKDINWKNYYVIAYPKDLNYIIFYSFLSPYIYIYDRGHEELHEVETDSFTLEYAFINRLIAAYEVYRGVQK